MHRISFVESPCEDLSGRSRPSGRCKPIAEQETIGNICRRLLMLELLKNWMPRSRFRTDIV